MVENQIDDAIRIKGSFRLAIAEDGKILHTTDWHENQVTNDGKRYYLAALLGALAGSSQIGFLGLGTGTAPAAAATTLEGEVTKRAAVTAASSGSTAVTFTATFASSNSFVTATKNIANIGLFASSATGAGTVFAGNTFASSSCATNQDVYTTYTITF
jgi:hypothetical protein